MSIGRAVTKKKRSKRTDPQDEINAAIERIKTRYERKIRKLQWYQDNAIWLFGGGWLFGVITGAIGILLMLREVT